MPNIFILLIAKNPPIPSDTKVINIFKFESPNSLVPNNSKISKSDTTQVEIIVAIVTIFLDNFINLSSFIIIIVTQNQKITNRLF